MGLVAAFQGVPPFGLFGIDLKPFKLDIGGLKLRARSGIRPSLELLLDLLHGLNSLIHQPFELLG